MSRISIMDPIYRMSLGETAPPPPKQPMRAFCGNDRCGTTMLSVPGAGRMKWVEQAKRQDQMCPGCGHALYWSRKWHVPGEPRPSEKAGNFDMNEDEASDL